MAAVRCERRSDGGRRRKRETLAQFSCMHNDAQRAALRRRSGTIHIPLDQLLATSLHAALHLSVDQTRRRNAALQSKNHTN